MATPTPTELDIRRVGDPRHARGVRHPSVTVVAITVCADSREYDFDATVAESSLSSQPQRK
jgi:hypothetical protein